MILQNYLEQHLKKKKKTQGFQIWLETGLDVYFPHCLSGKKGWVIETAASASGLGPGSVSTLLFALLNSWLLSGEMLLLTSHTGSQLPRRVPREAGSLSSEKHHQKVVVVVVGNRAEKASRG